MREGQLKQAQTILLKTKGFAYLRYLHLREFIAVRSSEIETVGICGAGKGIAELAVALEFPQIRFLLTDIVAEGRPPRPNYFTCMEYVMKWNVLNVRFGVWDLLKPQSVKFDVVASTEVLEHIKDATLALRNKTAAAKKYVYTLIPYATADQNADAQRRLNAFSDHGHYVCGFDASFFRAVGKPLTIAGAYWRSYGVPFRAKIADLSGPEVDSSFDELVSEARGDLTPGEPSPGACMAIKAVIDKTAG